MGGKCGECDPTSNCNNVRRKALRFNMGERGGGEKNRLWAAHIIALQKEGEKGGGGEIMPHKSSAKWVLGGGKSRGRRSTYDLIVWGFQCSLSIYPRRTITYECMQVEQKSSLFKKSKWGKCN